MVLNVHERKIAAPPAVVAELIDSLASSNDRLWPSNDWPAMCLDRGLEVGSAGGHGPVRYTIEHYEPGRRVKFRFTGPEGFHGHHSFAAFSNSTDSTLLRHELFLRPRGIALITWPLFFRPLHNALVKESLDRAERECGAPARSPSRRTLWTRVLRAALSQPLTPHRKNS